MKKIILLLISAMLIFSLFSCNSQKDDNTTTSLKEDIPSLTKTTVQTEFKATESLENFFDDAVFVGDSVSLKLSIYVSNRRSEGEEILGKAKFLCSGSLGFTNALWELNASNNVHPRYNGFKYRIPDGVAAIGAKKMFIMLGMNDYMLYGMDGTIQSAVSLIEETEQKSPGIKIYVQSVTPILKSKEAGKRNNANADLLNSKLQKMCSEHGWCFVNVAPIFKNEENCLREDYCSDPTQDGMGMHFTDAACQKWIEFLENIDFQTE